MLRDVYVRGKYRDVILPMVVIRRLDAVLEPTKQAVLDMKKMLDAAGITSQDAALRQASRQAFYNALPFILRDLRGRARTQQLKADFEAYLDGFSPNVQEILDNLNSATSSPHSSKPTSKGILEAIDMDSYPVEVRAALPIALADQDAEIEPVPQHSDKQNARIEHDKALQRVLVELLSDHTELFKQCSDNAAFKKWLTDTIFTATYAPPAG